MLLGAIIESILITLLFIRVITIYNLIGKIANDRMCEIALINLNFMEASASLRVNVSVCGSTE